MRFCGCDGFSRRGKAKSVALHCLLVLVHMSECQNGCALHTGNKATKRALAYMLCIPAENASELMLRRHQQCVAVSLSLFHSIHAGDVSLA